MPLFDEPTAEGNVSQAVLPPEIESNISMIVNVPKGVKASWAPIWSGLNVPWNEATKKKLRSDVRKKHTLIASDLSLYNKDDLSLLTSQEKVSLAEIVRAKGLKIGVSTYIAVLEKNGRFGTVILANVETLKAELKTTKGDKVKK